VVVCCRCCCCTSRCNGDPCTCLPFNSTLITCGRKQKRQA
jgi:hypothetical protein